MAATPYNHVEDVMTDSLTAYDWGHEIFEGEINSDRPMAHTVYSRLCSVGVVFALSLIPLV